MKKIKWQNSIKYKQYKSNKIITPGRIIRLMIFPTDYRQRMIKEEKSRQYKAMLDQQIRQNNLINQQFKPSKINHRIRTEPIESYNSRDRTTALARQLQHESSFLPTISPKNHIIDHNFRYLGSPDTSSRRFFSNLSAKKNATRKQNDEDLDDHLDRCLDECDQLINGISKNFINLNSHLRSNKPHRMKNYDGNSYEKSRHHSDFDAYNKGQDLRISRGSHLPVTSLRSSQLFEMDSDVGRNQMMNYNMHKARQKQILHISTPGEGYSPAQKDFYDNSMQKSGSITKRKNINDLVFDKVKTNPNKLSNGINFDTINLPNTRNSSSKLQNQFTNINLPHSMSSQLNQSVQKMKKQAKKKADQLKVHQEMKKKNNKILQHLRKAKNKGSILFKKIQVFRKQKEDLQNLNSEIQQPTNTEQTIKSKAASRNTEKNPTQSRNSYVSQENKIQKDMRKEEISVQNSNKKLEPKEESKASQLNSRANSKLSQKG